MQLRGRLSIYNTILLILISSFLLLCYSAIDQAKLHSQVTELAAYISSFESILLPFIIFISHMVYSMSLIGRRVIIHHLPDSLQRKSRIPWFPYY